MSDGEFGQRRLDALRELAGACQCIPGSIQAIRTALAAPAMAPGVAVLTLLSLAGYYAPVCRDRRLLSATLADYRTVSRRPRRLGDIAAPSATEALLKLARSIVQTAEGHAKIGIESLAAQRRRPEGFALVCLETCWPAIRDDLAKSRLPTQRQLENYRAESEWEYGQAVRRWEAEQRESAGKEMPSAPAAREENAPPNQKPKKLLHGWHAITSALALRYAQREDVKRLNTACQGPITSQGQGTKPKVYEEDLVSWWNKLALRQQDLANQRAGARLSAQAQHAYGRDAAVAPEIGGGVKKRRRGKST